MSLNMQFYTWICFLSGLFLFFLFPLSISFFVPHVILHDFTPFSFTFPAYSDDIQGLAGSCGQSHPLTGLQLTLVSNGLLPELTEIQEFTVYARYS